MNAGVQPSEGASGRRPALRVALALLWSAVHVGPRWAQAQDNAGALAQRYEALVRNRTRALAPGVYLESSETSSHTRGEVLARLDHPFPATVAALADSQAWCRLLMLHPNIKQCLFGRSNGGGVLLDVTMAAQRDGAFSQEHPIQLVWSTIASNATHLQVELMAERGPMGTRDYRIGFELAPLDGGGSVMRLVYSSAFTAAGLWMAQVYVTTVARHRVGFTVVDTDPQGRPVHVRGVRGAIERNTVRFYLAVQSWLAVQTRPSAERIPRAIETWFEASERYATQLHEVERDEYVARKTADFVRVSGLEAAQRTR